METAINSLPIWLLSAIIIAAVWEMIWKLIALWRAGRNNHLAWFICIGLINTIGVLPIIYILMHRNK
jgi:MFS superfamily sulfate permease-like transporter